MMFREKTKVQAFYEAFNSDILECLDVEEIMQAAEAGGWGQLTSPYTVNSLFSQLFQAANTLAQYVETREHLSHQVGRVLVSFESGTDEEGPWVRVDASIGSHYGNSDGVTYGPPPLPKPAPEEEVVDAPPCGGPVVSVYWEDTPCAH